METRHLGQASALPASPDEAVLDYVPNPRPDALYLVRFAAPEFTSLCPVTGQPDFAHLVIDYAPARDDRREQEPQAVPRLVPQPLRFPRGRDGRHRPAPGGRDEAAMAAHRRLLVSARRHADRCLLAERLRRPRACGCPTRACSHIAEGAEQWRGGRKSQSWEPARSAASSAAPGRRPVCPSPSSAGQRLASDIDEHGLTLSDYSRLAGASGSRRRRLSLRPGSARRRADHRLTVKSGGTADAAAEIAAHATPGASVISFQNGVSNVDMLEQGLGGRFEIARGMVQYNVAYLGEGRFHKGVAGNLFADRRDGHAGAGRSDRRADRRR